MKLTIVGAGHVGGQAAFTCALGGALSEIVLIDVQAGLARGKALDIQHALPLAGSGTRLSGSDRLDALVDSDIVVITAGFARRPGMQRHDLLRQNAEIVANIAAAVTRYAPASRIILVTNPVNVLASLVQRITEFPAQRVCGMGGVLDNARLAAGLASAMGVEPARVETLVIGDHGEHMVPVLGSCRLDGIPVGQRLSNAEIESIVRAARHAGTEIVELFGNGSAYFAPGMAVAAVVQAIARDTKQVLCCSTRAAGHYGLTGGYLGLPVTIGAAGVESVLTPELTAVEETALRQAWEYLQEQDRFLGND
ncbi:MAG: malate dehydrogenase [Thiohalobacteraceae bacterium]